MLRSSPALALFLLGLACHKGQDPEVVAKETFHKQARSAAIAAEAAAEQGKFWEMHDKLG